MTEGPLAPPWDFDYAPLSAIRNTDGELDRDLIIATTHDVDSARMVELLAGLVSRATVSTLFSTYPLFWTRLETSDPIGGEDVRNRLEGGGIGVRYVASTHRASPRLPPQLDIARGYPCRAHNWRTRSETTGSEPETPWRWFLGENGVNVRRSTCGTGSGTRLAVIDNDGRELDKVDLDAEELVGVQSVPRAGAHAGLLLGWAVGARTEDGSRFRGIAPDTCPRLYCIPKAPDLISLPLAVARATKDGADVIVCATYVEGLTSPMLDDALEFATRLGRNGRGTAMVFPTGREMASPPGATHSSLSLAPGDPASDPRIFCVGPSARDGGWFLWRDKKGELRPFANRGPAVRWLAPGDDMAYPFSSEDRAAHAESSGAAAVAAGVLSLLISRNPELRLEEVDALLRETSSPVDPKRQASDSGLADDKDLLPLGLDGDSHNAKHGYGRLDATAACLSATDPWTLTLLRIGDRPAALRYVEGRANGKVPRCYGDALAHWAARAALGDARLSHALAAIVRSVRLACRHTERFKAQPAGQLVRQLGLAVRLFLGASPPAELRLELQSLDEQLRNLQRNGSESQLEEIVVAVSTNTLGLGRPPNSGPTLARSTESGGSRSLPLPFRRPDETFG